MVFAFNNHWFFIFITIDFRSSAGRSIHLPFDIRINLRFRHLENHFYVCVCCQIRLHFTQTLAVCFCLICSPLAAILSSAPSRILSQLCAVAFNRLQQRRFTNCQQLLLLGVTDLPFAFLYRVQFPQAFKQCSGFGGAQMFFIIFYIYIYINIYIYIIIRFGFGFSLVCAWLSVGFGLVFLSPFKPFSYRVLFLSIRGLPLLKIVFALQDLVLTLFKVCETACGLLPGFGGRFLPQSLLRAVGGRFLPLVSILVFSVPHCRSPIFHAIFATIQPLEA